MVNLLRKKPKYFSLKLKINILIFAVMISISFIVSGYLTYNAEKKAMEMARSYIKTIPSIIDSSINNFMTAGDKEIVRKLILELSNVENVIGIHIFNPLGDISCNYSNFKTEAPSKYINLVYQYFSLTEKLQEINTKDVKMLSYYRPYENKPECKKCHTDNGDIIGVLNINVSTAGISEMLSSEIKTVNIIMLISSLIVSLLLSILINKLVVNPLKKLEEGMHKVSENDFNSKVTINSRDEFELISNYFNNMVSSLKLANETIDNMHKNLIHSDRLTTIGQLTASLSHEIKNPLNSIMITSDLLAMKCEMAKSGKAVNIDDTLKHIDNIINDTLRIKNIIDQTLNFSRLNTEQKQIVSVSSFLETINIYVKRILFDYEKVNFQLVKASEKGDCLLNINKTNIEQVFINILKNAMESIPEDRHGNIVINVSCSADHEYVIFKIIDDGVGISEDQLDKIFNEFYTTKKNGTGLGLPIAKDLIEQHNGKLKIESKVGVGTTVTIMLPTVKI
ncbi:HAMP domain-containing histidine kinase [Deferribacteraceae bacterium V6Fe1]|nr:HAMP domain-containing histidine kinase [Deferribacteraceae bacterium V6Fe1]